MGVSAGKSSKVANGSGESRRSHKSSSANTPSSGSSRGDRSVESERERYNRERERDWAERQDRMWEEDAQPEVKKSRKVSRKTHQ